MTRCEICEDGEVESLGHFLLACETLEGGERDEELMERNSGATAEE